MKGMYQKAEACPKHHANITFLITTLWAEAFMRGFYQLELFHRFYTQRMKKVSCNDLNNLATKVRQGVVFWGAVMTYALVNSRSLATQMRPSPKTGMVMTSPYLATKVMMSSYLYLRSTHFTTIMRGFRRTFATGVACRQGTLTPPDTLSCQITDLHMFYLLRPIFPNVLFFRTMLFEHPSILSQFCFVDEITVEIGWKIPSETNLWNDSSPKFDKRRLPSIDQTLHQFANLLPNWTLLPILTLLLKFGGFHTTLQRMRLANRGRLLLRTPGPVPSIAIIQ